MGLKLSKLLLWAFVLLVPLGLGLLLFAGPFNLISKLTVLLSPYRKLLPFMIAQAKHETANFKSNIFRTHKNLFGMKHPSERPSVGVKGDEAPDGGYYQRYTSTWQSVRDQLLYLGYVKFPVSAGSANDYVNALAQRGYFGRNPSPQAFSIYLDGVNHFLT